MTVQRRIAHGPLLTRLLAYCLEFTEGIAFSKGLSDPDEPAVVVRERKRRWMCRWGEERLTGAVQRVPLPQ